MLSSLLFSALLASVAQLLLVRAWHCHVVPTHWGAEDEAEELAAGCDHW